MKKRWFMLVGLLLIAGAVMAQGDAQAAADAAAAGKVEKISLLKLIKQGGWAMWPLGFCSFLMGVLIIQNFFTVRAKHLLHSEMMPELLKMMLNKKIKEALIYCREHPSLFTNIFGAGLERCLDMGGEVDFDRVRESVEEASVEEMTRVMKPIDMLSIIGAISPMLGLLGTVSGMIKAFHTMGSQGMGKPELLAANIGEALVTTAAGLLIAIPAMFFFFYFKKSFQKIMARMGRNIGYLFDALESGKIPVSFMDLEELKKLKVD